MISKGQLLATLSHVQETMKHNRTRLTARDLSIVMNGVAKFEAWAQEADPERMAELEERVQTLEDDVLRERTLRKSVEAKVRHANL